MSCWQATKQDISPKKRHKPGADISPQATCDAPAAFFSVDIAAAYPDAKVIILNREPEAWYQSCMASIYSATMEITLWQMFLILFDPIMKKYGFFLRRLQREAFGFRWPEREIALAFYEKCHSEFRDQIEAVRILEYKVQDGWEPLCKHLGVDVPKIRAGDSEIEIPFPHVNDAGAHKAGAAKKLKESRARSYRNLTEILAILVAGLYIIYRMDVFAMVEQLGQYLV
jgi:hypothetical protein